MRVLVSVRSGAEAAAACAGGAAIVDAKEPGEGALGAVTLATFREIHATVGGTCPVSAAAGEVSAATPARAKAFVDAGAAFVKVGFDGVAHDGEAGRLLRDVSDAAGARHVVAVAYADRGLSPAAIVELADTCRIAGVLIDTVDKQGPALPALVESVALRRLIADAHARGLRVALAGRLGATELPWARDLGADVAGVRGAACTGGRLGTVEATRVRNLLTMAGRPAAAPAPQP